MRFFFLLLELKYFNGFALKIFSYFSIYIHFDYQIKIVKIFLKKNEELGEFA